MFIIIIIIIITTIRIIVYPSRTGDVSFRLLNERHLVLAIDGHDAVTDRNLKSIHKGHREATHTGWKDEVLGHRHVTSRPLSVVM